MDYCGAVTTKLKPIILAMPLGLLRPVGELVPVFPALVTSPFWPAKYGAVWTDSGTSALAIAVRIAMHMRPSLGVADIVIPAYVCPDVVSAVEWAGANTTVADLQQNAPWLDAASVKSCISRSTVAVVAPHFLGIPHPVAALDTLSREHGVVLIEDSAQLGPTSPAFNPSADLVVLSFGRGKPVPVGGGALLFNKKLESLVERATVDLETETQRAWRWRLQVMLQNIAMTRVGYRLARSVPHLHVGATVFRRLQHVSLLSGDGIRLAASAIAAGCRSTNVESALCGLVESSPLDNLPEKLGWHKNAPLLRYPVLAKNVETRDSLIETMIRSGVTATKLYGEPLPMLPEMPPVNAPFGHPNASEFAARLLTLPCHSDVTTSDIANIENALKNPDLCRQSRHERV